MTSNNKRTFMAHFPPRASEWTNATILLLWSVITYNIGEDIHQGQAGFKDPATWALIFGLISGLRIVILYINGNLKRSPHFRSGLSFLSCFAWFQITLSLIATEKITTAFAVYPVLLALDFYNAYRTAVEARVTDEVNGDAGT